MSAIYVAKARSGLPEAARQVTALATGAPTSDPKLQSIMALNTAGKAGWRLGMGNDGLFTLLDPSTFSTSLSPLVLTSFTALTVGTPASGSITGATAGTLILVGNAPAGFTINSTARTWAYDGSGPTKSDTLILVEVPATALPNATRISYSVNAAAGATLDPTITPPDFTFTSVSTYPPELNFLLDETTVLDQDNLIIDAATDRAFASRLSGFPATVPLTTANITGTSPIYTAGALAGITSPAQTYLRARIERGSTSYSNWSAVKKHGDTVAPSVTTGATGTFAEQSPISDTWSTTEYVTVTLSGTDAALIETTVAGGTSGAFRLLANASPDYPTKASYSFNAIFTDDAGNVTTVAKSWTISSLDRTPNAFTFTDVSGASQSTLYTSNSITVTGVDATLTNIAASVTNAQYQITRGGTPLGWQSAGSFTTRLNDVIQLRLTSGAYSTATNAVLTVGGVSDTYTVSVMADPSGVGFTPSTTQPGDLSPGFIGSFSTTMDFQVGQAVVHHFISSGNTANVTCTIGGVPATVIGGAANGIDTVFAANISVAGSKTVTFTANDAPNVFNQSTVSGGTIIGAQSTPSSTIRNATGYVNLPWSGSPLTVLTNGLGLFFLYDGDLSGTLSGCAQVALSGHVRIATSPVSSTPGFSAGNNGYHGVVGLALQK